MHDIHRFILAYSTQLKYGLLIVFVFSMIVSIRTYINYVSIEDAIGEVKEDISYTQEEMFFTEKFYINYLSSAYADYFLAHENNILFGGEFIVKFEEKEKKLEEETQESDSQKRDTKTISTPQDSWSHFIKEKMKHIR